MMSEDYTPWLLEVNSSPGMLPSSIDKAKLCAAVINDTIKGNEKLPFFRLNAH
jgi:D-alanine-D-alanine ligase-like ATP-grasp enzyme